MGKRQLNHTYLFGRGYGKVDLVGEQSFNLLVGRTQTQSVEVGSGVNPMDLGRLG